MMLVNSDYKIYALFLTGIIEGEFRQSNFDYSEKLLNTAEELSYINPDVITNAFAAKFL